jgi:general secretion pathway protein L
MKYLALDVGSYSIKSMLIKYERKQLFLLDASEFVLDELRGEIDPEGDDLSVQKNLIKNIIPSDFDGKVIWQLPNRFITSRHMLLPVTQKKKIDSMIPFQLDENLPFSSSDAHYFSQQIKKGTQTSVLINVTKKSQLKEYFELFDEQDLLPTMLSSELSTINSYSQHKNIAGPMAILDIGHKTAKCYIIFEGEVVSHHYSFTAGAAIDEVISKTYQIPMNEAVIYKHQNCFFLTEAQYGEVSEDQREFAILMKKTMMPLILDLKRWLLGFRVKYGVSIDNVLLTGGSSNIHNIGNFFSQHTGVKVDYLSLGESLIDTKELLAANEGSYFISGLMGLGLTSKMKPGNFLQGQFSTGSNLMLPLHSASFILNRAFIALIFLGLILGIDTWVQTKREVAVEKKIRSVLKKNKLGLSLSLYKQVKKNKFDKMDKIMAKKEKAVIQEVKTLQASQDTNALSPLFTLFDFVSKNPNIELIEFSSDGNLSTGVFSSKNKKALSDLESSLKIATLKNLSLKRKGSNLNFSFGGKK